MSETYGKGFPAPGEGCRFSINGCNMRAPNTGGETMARSIFRFESPERVESPDRINEYIHVARPGVWVLTAALILVLAAFVFWGITGRIPDTVTYKGVVWSEAGCHIRVAIDASQYSNTLVGKEASFRLPDGTQGNGHIDSASLTPYSREELQAILQSDFLVSSLVSADYSYIVDVAPTIDLHRYNLEVAEVTIITKELPPISYLLR